MEFLPFKMQSPWFVGPLSLYLDDLSTIVPLLFYVTVLLLRSSLTTASVHTWPLSFHYLISWDIFIVLLAHPLAWSKHHQDLLHLWHAWIHVAMTIHCHQTCYQWSMTINAHPPIYPFIHPSFIHPRLLKSICFAMYHKFLALGDKLNYLFSLSLNCYFAIYWH